MKSKLKWILSAFLVFSVTAPISAMEMEERAGMEELGKKKKFGKKKYRRYQNKSIQKFYNISCLFVFN